MTRRLYAALILLVALPLMDLALNTVQADTTGFHSRVSMHAGTPADTRRDKAELL